MFIDLRSETVVSLVIKDGRRVSAIGNGFPYVLVKNKLGQEFWCPQDSLLDTSLPIR